MDIKTFLQQYQSGVTNTPVATPKKIVIPTIPNGPMSVRPLGGSTISSPSNFDIKGFNQERAPFMRIAEKVLPNKVYQSFDRDVASPLAKVRDFLFPSIQQQYRTALDENPKATMQEIEEGAKQLDAESGFIRDGSGTIIDPTAIGGPMKSVVKKLSNEVYTKLIRLVDRAEIQSTLRPLGLADDAERELADAIRMINTETKMQAGARKVEVQNIVDDVLRRHYSVETGPAKSVVQVVGKDGKNVFYEVSPQDLKVLSEDVIDGTGRGIAGKEINGNIYHLTAKTPTQMMERAGFKNGGTKTLDEIMEMITPKKRVAIRTEDGRYAGSFMESTPAYKLAGNQRAEQELIDEAKKYVTKEEFVNAQIKTLNSSPLLKNKSTFNEKTKGLFNDTFQIDENTIIARKAWSNKPWQVVETKDFQVVAKDDYKPLEKFGTRDELYNYLKTRDIGDVKKQQLDDAWKQAQSPSMRIIGSEPYDISIDEAQRILNTMFDPDEMKFIWQTELIDGKAVGKFSRTFRNLIELVESGGKVQSSTLYHEAFHGYFNTFIKPDERARMLKQVIEMKGEKSFALGQYNKDTYKTVEARAEEWLADDFARYVKDVANKRKPTSVFGEVWDKVMKQIKRWTTKANHFDQIYQDILNKKERTFVDKTTKRKSVNYKQEPPSERAPENKPEKEYQDMIMKMELAEAGKRHFIPQGDSMDYKVVGQKSSFPEWMPEDLRSRELFDKYMEGRTGSLDDFKKQYKEDSRLARIDDVVRDNLYEKTGYDLRLNPKEMQQFEETAKELQSIQQSLQSEKPQLRYRQNSTSPLPDDIPEEDVVKKITEMIKKAKPLQRKQDKIYSEERGRRVAQMIKAGEEVGGEKGYFAQLATQKGMLPRVDFEAVKGEVSQKNIDSLFDRVEQSAILSPFEKLTTKTGLAKILGGTLPTRSETKLLSEVFPKEFIDAVMDKRPWNQKFFEGFSNVINIPRAIMATADLSAALRQGVFLIGRPKQFLPAFRDMFKYAFDEKAYVGLNERIQARPTYKQMREGGLSLTDLGKFVDNREEQFMSNIVDRIPILGSITKGSSRAYTGFLNQLRADVFDDLWKNAKQLGIDKERPEVIKDIAKFVNSATGRGDLGMFNRAAPILNGIFFSPRLLASRLNLLNPVFYARLDPFVRKEALKSLFTFVGTMGTIVTLAKLNGADVETDPRSADFGKMKFGDTRYDIFGGFQQYIRLASQLVTGKIISSTTGKEITLGEGYKPLTRLNVLTRFFQNKEAPVLSFVTALMNGQNSMGEKTNVPTEIINRAIPLVAQDMYDLYQEWGPQGIAMGLPAILGIGSQTYGGQELVKGKNKIGQDTAQLKPVKGLSEKIAEMLGVQPDLSSTPAYAVSSFVDELQKLPKSEAADRFDEIKEANPKLAKKLVEELKDRELGITEHEKSIRAKGVESGDRAMAIAEEINALETKEEKADLWEDYTKKKLITKDVADQLKLLLANPE